MLFNTFNATAPKEFYDGKPWLLEKLLAKPRGEFT